MDDSDTTRKPETAAPSAATDAVVVSREATQAIPAPSSPDKLEPTQAMSLPPADDALLADAERRRQAETKLASIGMSPIEIQRLLAADAHTTDSKGTAAPPAMALPSLPGVPSKKAPTVTAESLQSFASELMAAKAAAQVEAVEKAEAALALPEFRESTAQERQQAETLLREAHMLRRKEKYREAMAKCREAIQLVPQDAAALEMLGDLLQGIAHIDEALAAYRRAREADPKRAIVERKYGDLLMRQQNWGGVNMEAIPTNSYVSVLLSLFLPGAGQIHNGEVRKGVFFFVLDAICAYLLFWSPWSSGRHSASLGIMLMAGVVYIAAAADANITAQRNKRANRSNF